MKKLMISVLIVMVLILGACAQQDAMKKSGEPLTKAQTTAEVTETAPSDAGVQVHDVRIKDLKFVPADITINVGDTVIWTKEDSIAHTVTSEDASFDSGRLGQGQSYS